MSAERIESTVTLHDAAALLGVHYQTAYRWVRQGQLPAVKVSGVYRVDPADVDGLLAHRARPVAPPQRRHVRDWAPFARRLYDRLIVGDEVGTRELLDDLVSSGSTLAEVCDLVIVPALVRIGDAWVAGEVTIAGEHRASAICERAIGRLTPSPPGRPRGVALVCSPPGDDHQLPGQMATAVLREDHWRVHHLGTGVPIPDVIRMVEEVGASLVAISLTWPPSRPLGEEMVAQVEAKGVRALLGRPGLTLVKLVTLARGDAEPPPVALPVLRPHSAMTARPTPAEADPAGHAVGASSLDRALRQVASTRPSSVEGGASTQG